MPALIKSPNGYVIFDDTAVDKNHSRNIELVRKQYSGENDSGNTHRVIRGIDLVYIFGNHVSITTFDFV